MNKPLWIVLEGGDGAGKGIAGGVVQDLFNDRQMPFIKTREPGGTPEGEDLRRMLLGESGHVWEKTSEIMLMTTSRVQHVSRVIRPHLAAGTSVLCDRYVHSTLAYQGYGHEGPIDFIERLHQEAVGGDMPDLTIILDIDPEIGIARAKRRLEEDCVDEGRMEGLAMEFHQRVRRGYLTIAANDPARHIVVDASRSIPEVREEISNRLSAWIETQQGRTAPRRK
ncbi:dTMP kinase [Sphingomonas sp. 3-13AW]|uniref:dTMP kinase n=1 Tax=Sphingomonas sp. 3-13AW TaxID=3050450 RepID=UPI003BB78446